MAPSSSAAPSRLRRSALASDARSVSARARAAASSCSASPAMNRCIANWRVALEDRAKHLACLPNTSYASPSQAHSEISRTGLWGQVTTPARCGTSSQCLERALLRSWRPSCKPSLKRAPGPRPTSPAARAPPPRPSARRSKTVERAAGRWSAKTRGYLVASQPHAGWATLKLVQKEVTLDVMLLSSQPHEGWAPLERTHPHVPGNAVRRPPSYVQAGLHRGRPHLIASA